MNKYLALIPITGLVLLTTAGCATTPNGNGANNNRTTNVASNTSDVNAVSNSTGVTNNTTSNGDNTTTDMKLDVVKVFDKALHVSLDNSGSNPYNDVPSSDWGYVHAAVENGYFTADTSSHFGSGDGMALKDVDHAYQLYVGIPDNHIAWNAGGSTVGFADALGLNNALPTVLSQNNISELSTNLSRLYQGYYKDHDGVYHVVFQPYDAYKVFAHEKPLLPQKTVANDLAKDIKLTDDTTLTLHGSTVYVHVDGLSASSKREIAVGLGGKMNKYSLNGGTWRRTPESIGSGYDSHNPTSGGVPYTPHSVVVKGANPANFEMFSWIGKQDIGLTGGELSFSNFKITSVQYHR